MNENKPNVAMQRCQAALELLALKLLDFLCEGRGMHSQRLRNDSITSNYETFWSVFGVSVRFGSIQSEINHIIWCLDRLPGGSNASKFVVKQNPFRTKRTSRINRPWRNLVLHYFGELAQTGNKGDVRMQHSILLQAVWLTWAADYVHKPDLTKLILLNILADACGPESFCTGYLGAPEGDFE